MEALALPIPTAEIAEIATRHPTPFHLYDEGSMLSNVARLQRGFAWNRGFKEFFAVKATPNPYIMKLLAKAGLGMDCSSYAELRLSQLCGVRGEDIMFTSNNTPASDYAFARELGAIINLDDRTHLPYLEAHVGLPALLSFRFNPGPAMKGSVIIGAPEEAKFGLTGEQILDAYRSAKEQGVTRFGLHTMPISNDLNLETFTYTVRMLLDLSRRLHAECGIECEFLNMGGGIGIPYRPTDTPFNFEALGEEIRVLYGEYFGSETSSAPALYMECGRCITGPYGMLVTRAIHKKEIYRNYIGVDATMADLMRPGMYGAYHHITVVGKENVSPAGLFDVVGSLCENNDKFAVQRPLPPVEPGDLLVIHDTGAHGHSMGFNYNGKLRSAELLKRHDGSVIQIRRRETLDDYFATLNLTGVPHFV